MTYYTKGKLLLTGEYAVLKGAKAYAIPAKYGQSLEVKPNHTNRHQWRSYDLQGMWFEVDFSLNLNRIIQTNEPEKAKLLQKILQYIQQKKSNLFKSALSFITQLDYNRLWGLGSSSTLLVNLYKWSGVNAFELLNISFGGSGYDIAVGLAGQPILYQLVTPDQINLQNTAYNYGYKTGYNDVNLLPLWQINQNKSFDFEDKLWLVYLNKKQSSRQAVQNFKKRTVTQADLHEISRISEKLFNKDVDYELFVELLNRHEHIISSMINQPTIKQILFKDYPGTIKSLGAWGGDFILATGKDAPAYFYNKGYQTIIGYPEIL